MLQIDACKIVSDILDINVFEVSGGILHYFAPNIDRL